MQTEAHFSNTHSSVRWNVFQMSFSENIFQVAVVKLILIVLFCHNFVGTFQIYLKRPLFCILRLRVWSRIETDWVEKRRTLKGNCRKQKSSWLKPNRNKKSWKNHWIPQRLESYVWSLTRKYPVMRFVCHALHLLDGIKGKSHNQQSSNSFFR